MILELSSVSFPVIVAETEPVGADTSLVSASPAQALQLIFVVSASVRVRPPTGLNPKRNKLGN